MSVSEGVKLALCPQAEAALERLRVGLKAAAEDADVLAGTFRGRAGVVIARAQVAWLQRDLANAARKIQAWQGGQS